MKIYQVGGSVRDELMGLQSNDIDWVVVGSDRSEMESLGFRRVGKSFPVFLHPDTNEEYALARTEKSTGVLHTSFSVKTDGVTLEQDLSRRDLTINSIAKCPDTGEIIDPYGGLHDIKNKILRHTSGAFIEDPVRPIRLARFLARFGPSWTVAPETVDLIQTQMTAANKHQYLDKNRMAHELKQVLHEPHAVLFFDFLQLHYPAYNMPNVMTRPDIFRNIINRVIRHPDTNIHDRLVVCSALDKGLTGHLNSEIPAYVHLASFVVTNLSYTGNTPEKVRDVHGHIRKRHCTESDIEKAKALVKRVTGASEYAGKLITTAVEYGRYLESVDFEKIITQAHLTHRNPHKMIDEYLRDCITQMMNKK